MTPSCSARSVIDFALPLSIRRRQRCARTSAWIRVASRRGFRAGGRHDRRHRRCGDHCRRVRGDAAVQRLELGQRRHRRPRRHSCCVGTSMTDRSRQRFAGSQSMPVSGSRADFTSAQPPCISQLPVGAEPARLMADGSPPPPRAEEPVSEHGAPSAVSFRNPNSRLGRRSPASRGRARIHKDGSWISTPPWSRCSSASMSPKTGVHLLPSGEAFAATRDHAGLEGLVARRTWSFSRRPAASKSPSPRR